MKPSLDLKRELTTDPDAQTAPEIAKETGLSDSTVREHAKKMVESGKWRQVWKKSRNGFIAAYIAVEASNHKGRKR